ncbi:Alpha/beta hydrolase fold-1 [Artemisia annua]|uniref:Alpha/beta hydrolase fold-1 n=1 Tax=Artemisia annua TaxID=35608 RepID=A0A2U1KTU7_ARTAN|nr:Alpha/beta hydrolase fold-1 [Artemisia annua]
MAKKKGIEGLSDQMNAIASQNLQHAQARKRVRLAFTQVQEQLDRVLFKMAPTDTRTEEVMHNNQTHTFGKLLFSNAAKEVVTIS